MAIKLGLLPFAVLVALAQAAHADSVFDVQPSSVQLVMGPTGVTNRAVSFAYSASTGGSSYSVYGSTQADCFSNDAPAWMDFQQTGDSVVGTQFENYDVRIAITGYPIGFSGTGYFCIRPNQGFPTGIAFTLSISGDVIFQDGFEQ